jgi:mannose-6-phosphate isomerase-like protein (cupin superfamily)
MTTAWATEHPPTNPSCISPSGVTEIRSLPSFEQGEIVHATTPPGEISTPAVLSTILEVFHILEGMGELWRKLGGQEQVVDLLPGCCVSMPAGISFQYQAIGEAPMRFLVITMPKWRSQHWREAPEGFWGTEQRPRPQELPNPEAYPWKTQALRDEPDYLAPDTSEIRLLVGDDRAKRGGVAHCTLPAGKTSQAVQHGTVVEIWYVIEGQGQVWRREDARQEVVEVEPGTCLTIPLSTSFQFRASAAGPLRILIGTFPSWPGPQEAQPIDGNWPI